MEIAGLLLQLVAGIILALPHLFPEDWFISADNKVRNIIRWPLNNKRGLLLCATFSALFIVCGYFAFSIFIQTEPALQWYNKTVLIVFYISTSVFLYVYLIYNLLRLIARINRSILSINRPYWSYGISNSVSAFVFLTILILSLSGLKAILQHLETTSTFFRVLLNASVPVLIQIVGFSSLAFLYSSLVLIILAPTITLSAIASPIKKPLWGIVIVLFTTGGILLIAHALNP